MEAADRQERKAFERRTKLTGPEVRSLVANNGRVDAAFAQAVGIVDRIAPTHTI